jgi:hypothetical protein
VLRPLTTDNVLHFFDELVILISVEIERVTAFTSRNNILVVMDYNGPTLLDMAAYCCRWKVLDKVLVIRGIG